jgi:adenylate cyclase class IV
MDILKGVKMNSRLTEEKRFTGVIVKHGNTEIECRNDAEAIQIIKNLGYTEADIVSPNGTYYHVTENVPINQN